MTYNNSRKVQKLVLPSKNGENVHMPQIPSNLSSSFLFILFMGNCASLPTRKTGAGAKAFHRYFCAKSGLIFPSFLFFVAAHFLCSSMRGEKVGGEREREWEKA